MGRQFVRGSSQSFHVGDAHDNVGITAWTVQAWIKATSGSDGLERYIISKEDAGTNGWSLKVAGTSPNTRLIMTWPIEGLGWQVGQDSGDVSAFYDRWVAVGASWRISDARARSYINGSITMQGTMGGPTTEPAVNLTFGALSNGTNYFDGVIAEVAIWRDVELSSDQMFMLARGRDARIIDSPVGYWPLTEALGLTDLVGGLSPTNNGTTAVEDHPFYGRFQPGNILRPAAFTPGRAL
jgi:hypothetical protein